MEEIWKDVKGYEGYYQVSNLGRVKSCSRVVRNRYSEFETKERILKNQNNGKGYYQVTLSFKSKRKTILVHQLVAVAFLGYERNGYDDGFIVDHIDNCKTNNRLDNLQLITPRENCSKDRKNKTSRYTGVCWNKQSKKWQVAMTNKGGRLLIGYFDCELAAAKAYQDKLKQINK